MKRMLSSAAFSLAVLWAGSASAGTVTSFFDLGAFTADVGPTVVEDFGATHSFPIQSGVLNAASDFVPDSGVAIVPGDIVAGVTFSTQVTSGLFFNIDNGGGFFGGFLDSLSVGNVLTVTFDTAQSAFGFVTNSLVSQVTVSIAFSDGSGWSGDFSVADYPVSEFFGFASDANDISSIQISSTGTRFAFALDDFRFAASAPDTGDGGTTVVPLPAAAPLLLAGIGGLALLRRRRRDI